MGGENGKMGGKNGKKRQGDVAVFVGDLAARCCRVSRRP